MTMPGNTSGTARLILGELGYQVGWQQPVYLPKPAAGQPWARKVDGRYFERVIAVSWTLTTDVVVGNRFMALDILDSNGALILEVPASGLVAASTTFTTYLMLEAPAFATTIQGAAYAFMPDLLLPPDWTVKGQVYAMDPGDQVSAVTLIVQQFPNDAAVQPS